MKSQHKLEVVDFKDLQDSGRIIDVPLDILNQEELLLVEETERLNKLKKDKGLLEDGDLMFQQAMDKMYVKAGGNKTSVKPKFLSF